MPHQSQIFKESSKRKLKLRGRGDDESSDLYDRTMKLMRKRMLFTDDLMPPLLASLGAHLLNLLQYKDPFYYVKGEPEDLAVCVGIVAPTRLSKSYAMKMVFDRKGRGISPAPFKFRGKITEAGFVGTASATRGATDPILGDAWDLREGFLLFNEISNLFLATKQEHSGELINQVMEALTERYVSKKLGSVPIGYETFVTIWGGVQPKRFDFSAGLGSRFIFVVRNWTDADLLALKNIRLNCDRSRATSTSYDDIKTIRREISMITEQCNIKEIKFELDILRYLYHKTESHTQMQLLERVLIGKETLDQALNETLKIYDSYENRELVDMLIKMQNMVSLGSDVSLMLTQIGEDKNGMTLYDLWGQFRRFGYTYDGFHDLVENCIKLGLIYRIREVRGPDLKEQWVYRKRGI